MAFQYISKKQYPIYDMVIGDDWKELIPIVQSDGTTPWVFTSWEATAEVVDKITGAVIITFSTEYSVPTIEFSGGDMYLIADAADTAALTPANYIWRCKFTDAEGLERTLIKEGPFEIVEFVAV